MESLRDTLVITSLTVSTLIKRELDEDRIKIEHPLDKEKKVYYFAIFDGHKGEEISDKLKNELHKKVVN